MKDEVPRIKPAFDRDLTNEVSDLGCRHPIDAERRLLDGEPERGRDPGIEHLPRAREIKCHRPAEEDARVHVANEHEDVGECWLVAAKAVAHRPRPGARGARPDPRRKTPLLQPDDGTAARSDRHDLNFRLRVVVPIDHRLPRVFDLPPLDDAHLERRATHVGGDDIRLPQRLTKGTAANDPCGRAALEHADRPLGRLGGGQETAVSLHDHHWSGIAGTAEECFKAANVVAGDVTGVRIDDGGRGSLVLARGRRDIARQGAVETGCEPFENGANLLLMGRVVERPQE